MALNADGFEGGAILTLEQQAQLRVKQHAEIKEQADPTESAVSVKRKRKASADKFAVVETAEETAESE